MPRISLPRTTRTHKIAAAVLVTVGASTALAATAEPSSAQIPAQATASVKPVSVNGLPAKDAPKKDAAKPAAKSAKDEKAAKAKAAKAKAEKAAKAKAAAKKAAAKHKAAAPKVYKNNLDGWIKESLAIMKAHHIPGTYEGLHRNIMRESSGNPNAVNNWDINAQNGVPSKGLLQVIQPTFDTYHVAGTAYKLTDPVANLTAAANYAAHRYGSIDNVNSAY
ncbi:MULTISPECIES: transglycosylase SLT domain-containing protein [unclassified Streptomyces]|uniref:transglycosylase SLT domain-containing protein n=1 Tax=unclassified Streptomyces TaxID=2593676 RepID=UPI002E22F6F1|nr:transglycosylase SLT domain-containing protein [Streptomyces sp. NBC_01023]